MNLDQFGLLEMADAGDRSGLARVTAAFENRCRVMTDGGEREAMYGPGVGMPGWIDGICAGDWVRVSEIPGDLRVDALLPRKTCLTRRASGGVPRDQVIAANIDNAMIVTSLNADYNPARIERYLAAAWDSGAQPFVILSKADLCPNAEEMAQKTRAFAPGADVLCVSAVSGAGMEELISAMRRKTSALIGMSGVGKSSLINCIAGEERMRVNEIREDDARGRHTTTYRQLMLLREDILVIDTPGMRSLGLSDGDGLASAYADIEQIAAGCRFSDCRHDREPDCAVRRAVAEGLIDERRLRSYRTLFAQTHGRKPKPRAQNPGKKPKPRADLWHMEA